MNPRRKVKFLSNLLSPFPVIDGQASNVKDKLIRDVKFFSELNRRSKSALPIDSQSSHFISFYSFYAFIHGMNCRV